MQTDTFNIAVLISGRGSNLASLISAAASPDWPGHIQLVLSNRRDAPGLDVARTHGIAAECVDHRQFASREAFEDAVQGRLEAHAIDIVACAGFMRVLTGPFVARWSGRIVNIHPSLLPAYRGLHTHERALADGALEHGCTVHHITAGLDEGPAIAQGRVKVLENDTPDTLAARVLAEEHRLYPAALARLMQTMGDNGAKVLSQK